MFTTIIFPRFGMFGNLFRLVREFQAEKEEAVKTLASRMDRIDAVRRQ